MGARRRWIVGSQAAPLRILFLELCKVPVLNHKFVCSAQAARELLARTLSLAFTPERPVTHVHVQKSQALCM